MPIRPFHFAFVALASLACAKEAAMVVTKDATAPSSTEPMWLASASRAPAPLANAARDARLSPVGRPPNAAAIDAVLNDVAKQEASSSGIKKAATLLKESAPKLVDPEWAGSGTAPFARWLHLGGIAVLADLAQRACAARPGDQEVWATITSVELPPVFNSGGIDQGAMGQKRELLKQSAAGCAAH